ncbi:MAG: HAD hydrolase family protein [Bacteroidales bacterium]|nr:HAD hydrolase family protein [Bacteroidales bacterium]
MRKRYLFFDIDGTLISAGYGNPHVPQSTRTALRKLKEAGHFLALSTGRSEAMARPYLSELGIENMVSDGGYGLIFGGRLLEIRPLPKEKMVSLVRECQRKGIPWGLQPDNSVVRLCPDGSFYDATHDIYMETKVVPGLDPEQFDIIYKAYVACLPGEEKNIEAMEGLPFCRSKNEYIFVEPTAKAEGIMKMMDMLGAPYEDAVVFGDSLNDMSMFTGPWIKVAMGNAVRELKDKADFITRDVDDDGIYYACETLGLF